MLESGFGVGLAVSFEHFNGLVEGSLVVGAVAVEAAQGGVAAVEDVEGEPVVGFGRDVFTRGGGFELLAADFDGKRGIFHFVGAIELPAGLNGLVDEGGFEDVLGRVEFVVVAVQGVEVCGVFRGEDGEFARAEAMFEGVLGAGLLTKFGLLVAALAAFDQAGTAAGSGLLGHRLACSFTGLSLAERERRKRRVRRRTCWKKEKYFVLRGVKG